MDLTRLFVVVHVLQYSIESACSVTVDCLFGVLLSVVYSFVAVAIVYFDASVHRL